MKTHETDLINDMTFRKIDWKVKYYKEYNQLDNHFTSSIRIRVPCKNLPTDPQSVVNYLTQHHIKSNVRLSAELKENILEILTESHIQFAQLLGQHKVCNDIKKEIESIYSESRKDYTYHDSQFRKINWQLVPQVPPEQTNIAILKVRVLCKDINGQEADIIKYLLRHGIKAKELFSNEYKDIVITIPISEQIKFSHLLENLKVGESISKMIKEFYRVPPVKRVEIFGNDYGWEECFNNFIKSDSYDLEFRKIYWKASTSSSNIHNKELVDISITTPCKEIPNPKLIMNYLLQFGIESWVVNSITDNEKAIEIAEGDHQKFAQLLECHDMYPEISKVINEFYNTSANIYNVRNNSTFKTNNDNNINNNDNKFQNIVTNNKQTTSNMSVFK